MRAPTTSLTLVSALLLSLPGHAEPPARGRTVLESAAGGGPDSPAALHAYLLDDWRAAQPVPLRLLGVLGPGPALAAASASGLCAPLPALQWAASVALYNVTLAPEPPEALVAVAQREAQRRADSILEEALGVGATWRLTTPFATRRGALPAPVEGRVEAAFGPVRVPGLYTTVRHPGQTWRVAPDTSVHAVARGIVRHAGELNGYGLVVIMDHGTGYHSVYAFLSRVDVRVGALLESEDVVGAAGLDAPEARQVYFEIRHFGDALDPAEWLSNER